MTKNKEMTVNIKRVTDGSNSHFFGYFDKCAWNADETKILAHEVNFDEYPPSATDKAIIGYVDLKADNNFVRIGETCAWNFQQGAMLQWHPAYPNTKIIFNDRQQNKYVTVIYDIETNEKLIFDEPVAAVSRDGRFAISLNFSRLYEMRPGYGYAGIVDKNSEIDASEDDGVKLIDLRTGDVKFLFSIKDVVDKQVDEALRKRSAKYWFNHALFTPDSERFCFFLRSREKDKVTTHTQLFTANIDGSDLYCLDDSGVISHFDWLNNEKLIAWARKKKPGGSSVQGKIVGLAGNPIFRIKPIGWLLNKLRGTVIGWIRNSIVGDRFVMYKDRTQERVDIGIGLLTEDAHCAFSGDGKYIAMDTYPHEDNLARLFLYDIKNNKVIDVAKLYSRPDLIGEVRCDLHVSWNRNGTKLCFDSVHEGKRQVYVVDIKSLIK